jgi:hypothetical protein
MNEHSNRDRPVHVEVHGNVSGPVAGVNEGTQIGTQIESVAPSQPGLTEAELTELRRALGELRARVAAEAPWGEQAAAHERVTELEAALTTDKPNPTTLTKLEYVRDWFLENLPGLAGSVTSIVVSPIVGKLVAAAGDTLVAEFQRRFPIA